MAIKVLTIRPGDQVVIPRNAVIKTAASDGNITVTSTCPEIQSQLLDNEFYQCYAFAVGTPAMASGDNAVFGEKLYIDGIEVSGKQYAFGTTITFDAARDSSDIVVHAKLLDALNDATSEIRKLAPLAGLLKSMCTKLGSTSTDNQGNGSLGYLSFKSLPSIAEQSSISLYGRMAGLTGGELSGTFSYLSWRAMPISSYSNAYVKPCNCTGE